MVNATILTDRDNVAVAASGNAPELLAIGRDLRCGAGTSTTTAPSSALRMGRAATAIDCRIIGYDQVAAGDDIAVNEVGFTKFDVTSHTDITRQRHVVLGCEVSVASEIRTNRGTLVDCDVTIDIEIQLEATVANADIFTDDEITANSQGNIAAQNQRITVG